MCEIIPGILEKNWEDIEKKIELVKTFSQTIHIDVIDGKFAPNITLLDPKPFEKYSKDLFFEVHLMVDDPISYLKPFSNAGFKRFLGHIEKMPDQVEFVAQGQILGEVGLAVDGPTPLEQIKVPLDDLDVLLLMTIKAGLSGQEMVAKCLEKVKEIRAKSDIKIQIDGGVNQETILSGRKSGANRFVSTSYLFKENPQKQFEILQSLTK